MIANHGQNKRYYHALVGVNSRLDGIQAAVLNVKLPRLNHYIEERQRAAAFYDQAFSHRPGIQIPVRSPQSTHVFHQYTLLVEGGQRDALQEHLQRQGIPTMIYYPVPLYAQEAFKNPGEGIEKLDATEYLCQSVLSLPMHTELDEAQLNSIVGGVLSFYNQ